MNAFLTGKVPGPGSVYTMIVDIGAMYRKPAAMRQSKRRKKKSGCKLLKVPRDYWFGGHTRP